MRTTRNQPFCWQEKNVNRTIRKHFQGMERAKMLLLYATLTEIDSDFCRQKIQFYTKTIHAYSGLSPRFISHGIQKLEEMGIISIKKIRDKKGKFITRELFFTPENSVKKDKNPIGGKPTNGQSATLEESNLLEESIEYTNTDNKKKIINSTNKDPFLRADAREEDKIPNLLEDNKKHIQIIGLYAKAKNVIFENIKQQQAFIKRHTRAASLLIGYSFPQIIKTMQYLIDNADFKWTLETVGKYIDENLYLLKIKNNKTYDLRNL